MKATHLLTPSELIRALAKADVESSAMCTRFIEANRGFEKPSETRLLSDSLALEWQAMVARHEPLQRERDRRVTYHGCNSLKRTP